MPNRHASCVRADAARLHGGRLPLAGTATRCPPAAKPGPAAPTGPHATATGRFGLIASLLGLLGGALGGRPALRRLLRGVRRERARRLVRTEIAAQRDRLRVRRLQLVSQDEYGSARLEKWQRESNYFRDTRLRPLLAARGLDGCWPAIAAWAARAVERAARPPRPRSADAPGPAASGFSPGMDPIAYEHHCALLLRQAGWDARVTQASGDQGVDIMARRDNALLVVQCKLYRGAVGNAAVQQVSAARLHHRAAHAAVVSNARFTPQAQALARTNDVHLLHHEELARFRPGPAASASSRSARR